MDSPPKQGYLVECSYWGKGCLSVVVLTTFVITGDWLFTCDLRDERDLLIVHKVKRGKKKISFFARVKCLLVCLFVCYTNVNFFCHIHLKEIVRCEEWEQIIALGWHSLGIPLPCWKININSLVTLSTEMLSQALVSRTTWL